MTRWLLAVLLLLPLAARADQVIDTGGTRWMKNGRLRVGPETCASADTRQDGHSDGTTAYFSDAQATCPMQCGGVGAWCVKEAGVWNCCRGGGSASCQQIPCDPGQVQLGTNANCTPICGDVPCGSAERCDFGSVVVGFDDSCGIICEPITDFCCLLQLPCCPSTTTTTTETTSTTSTTESTTTTTTTSTTTTTTGPPFSINFLWAPHEPFATGATNAFGTADVLYCDLWMPHLGISNATSLHFDITGTLGGVVCGFAIYSADGNTRLFSTGGLDCSSGGVHSTTGGAFTLTEGTQYQLCRCSNTTANPAFLAVSDETNASALADTLTPAGAFIAGNTCTSGVPPLTSGGANSSDTHRFPLVLLSTTTP